MEQLTAFAEQVLSSGPPASDFSGIHELLAELDEAEPARGELPELLDLLTRASAKGMNHLHPGFLAYIPVAGAPVNAVADFVAALLNRYVGVQWASPTMAQLEWNVVRWLAAMFGYPEEARGVLTSGGSFANFTALVTARHARLGAGHLQGAIYQTDQAHMSVERAARLAGVDPALVRFVATDDGLRMDVDALEEAIEADVSRGIEPFLVVLSAGTTNSGAVDPIVDAARVARASGAWVHVDAAYGGAFVLTEHGREVMRGIDEADSITFDPHKGLFSSMGLGCVLVRDGEAMRRAHMGEHAYLQPAGQPGLPPNLSDYSMELTRPFRGLRLWLALKLYGWEPFRQALELNRQLAVDLHRALVADDRYEAPWAPQLSTVVFRDAGGDEATERLLEGVNADGRVLLSSTRMRDRLWLRACFLSHRTDRATLEDLLDALGMSGAQPPGAG